MPSGIDKTVREKIIESIPIEGKFSAVDIAEKIDFKIYVIMTRGWKQDSCPYVTRVLTSLCKRGILYQWVIPAGSLVNDHSSKWELYYLHKDSNLFKTLMEARGKYLIGYRFK